MGFDPFSLLYQKPFKAEVSKASADSSGFTLILKREDGGLYSTYIGAQKDSPLNAFLATLKDGATYEFPKQIIEHLGLEGTVSVIRQELPDFRPSFAFRTEIAPLDRTLAGLIEFGKFQAKVLDKQVSEKEYSIILLSENFRLFLAEGVIDTAEMKVLVTHLRENESYDFPDVLKKFTRKAVDQMLLSQPLKKYVGLWWGEIEGMSVNLRMYCDWNADGSGLCREIEFDDLSDKEPPKYEEAVINYDPKSKAYLAVGGAVPLIMNWREKGNTFITMLPNPLEGHTRVNIATFTSDNHIDWRTITRDGNGKEIATTHGQYHRLQPRTIMPGFESNSSPSESSSSSSLFNFPTKEVPEICSWHDLGSCVTFRARVTQIQQSATKVSMKMVHTNGRRSELRYQGSVLLPEIKGCLSRLKEGEIYEFPDMLHHPELYQKPAPPSAEMISLQPFIGEWDFEEKWLNGEIWKWRLVCTWKADGKGMWREFVHEGTPETKVASLELITFDSVSGKHLRQHIGQRAIGYRDRPADVYEWDPEKKTVNSRASMPQPDGNVTNIITEFKSEDVIEWRAVTKNASGVVIDEQSGRYKRAAKK